MRRRVMVKEVRFIVVILLGAVCGLLSLVWFDGRIALLIGWDVAASLFLLLLYLDLRHRGHEHTAAIAKRDDMNRTLVDVVLIAASLGSIVAVFLLLSIHVDHSFQIERILLGLLTIVLSWSTVHTIYLVRYAVLYYRDKPGGINFNETAQPRFSDFAYLAFTIGMTYQVSDTVLETTEIRRVALHHALLSFVFDTAIIASTINLLVSLG